MNRTAFEKFFVDLVEQPSATPPYDNPDYQSYTKLNLARFQRWIKKGELLPELIAIIKNTSYTSWTIITEPWCGDAAHSVPFILLLAEQNPKIKVKIELRDSAPFLIENYLTNGSKSIPIFIFSNGIDEKTWGPRPGELHDLFEFLKSEGKEMEELKMALQKWYNEDKGKSLQKELVNLLK